MFEHNRILYYIMNCLAQHMRARTKVRREGPELCCRFVAVECKADYDNFERRVPQQVAPRASDGSWFCEPDA